MFDYQLDPQPENTDGKILMAKYDTNIEIRAVGANHQNGTIP